MRSKTPFFIALLFISLPLQAERINVAVASNFSPVMKQLIALYEQQSEHQVTLISGSTGKLYAQILNGAPFDAFFAADSLRPQKLENKKHIVPASRFTYAIGKIVLWSPDASLVDKQGQIIQAMAFQHLAIANPKLAPYGRAAQQVIESKGVWKQLQSKIVRGENIGHTYHFVKSGNAALGFIALSQIKADKTINQGSYWLAPDTLYDPIEQQAVQLSNTVAASDFFGFVQTQAAEQVIRDFGYDVR